jgi:hypothetical protein
MHACVYVCMTMYVCMYKVLYGHTIDRTDLVSATDTSL